MNNSEQIICNITNDILSEKGHALYQKWTNHYKRILFRSKGFSL